MKSKTPFGSEAPEPNPRWVPTAPPARSAFHVALPGHAPGGAGRLGGTGVTGRRGQRPHGGGAAPADCALQSRTRRQCPHSTGLSSREERAEVALSVDIRRMRGGRDAQEVKGDALAFTLGTEEQEKPATS